MSLEEYTLEYEWNLLINLITPPKKPVMLNRVLLLLLHLSLDCGPNLDLGGPGFSFSGHLFPVLSPRNMSESGAK